MGVRPEEIQSVKPYTYEEFERHVDAALKTKSYIREDTPGRFTIYHFSGPGRLDDARFKLSVSLYADRYARENGWSRFTSTASGTGLVLRKPLWPRKASK